MKWNHIQKSSSGKASSEVKLFGDLSLKEMLPVVEEWIPITSWGLKVIHSNLSALDVVHGALSALEAVHSDLLASEATRGDFSPSEAVSGDLSASEAVLCDLITRKL